MDWTACKMLIKRFYIVRSSVDNDNTVIFFGRHVGISSLLQCLGCLSRPIAPSLRWCDIRPRRCSWADIPTWRPQNSYHCIIGADNGLNRTGDKPLSEPMTVWSGETHMRHSVSMSYAVSILSRLSVSWWHHQMAAFSALPSLCEGNLSVTGEFPSQRPVTRSFNVFFDLRLNKRLSKQSWGWWFETP